MQKGKPQIPAGDTFRLIFDIVDGDGDVQSLDGVNVRWLLADSMASEVPILVKTYVDGVSDGIQLTLIPGQFIVRLDPEDTVLLGSRDYWQQATLLWPDGRVVTVNRSWVSILDTVI